MHLCDQEPRGDLEGTLHIPCGTCHPGVVVAFFLDELTERVKNINNYITFSLYCNVCRSLFEKHKLMFAFLVSARILMNEGKIDMVSESPQSLRGSHQDSPGTACSAPRTVCWVGKEPCSLGLVTGLAACWTNTGPLSLFSFPTVLCVYMQSCLNPLQLLPVCCLTAAKVNEFRGSRLGLAESGS